MIRKVERMKEIQCDMCGTLSAKVGGFEYMHRMTVRPYNGMEVNGSSIALSADICRNCLEKIKKIMIEEPMKE